MLLGFNTNYRYRGVLFHVQTEDSGVENPHVITHLFHGGNIMVSRKGDYSERLGSANLEGEVRTLMETQHKSMLKGLQRGEFDPVILQRIGPEVFKDKTDTADTMSDVEAAPTAPEPAAPQAASPPAEPQVQAQPPQASAEDQLNRAFGEGVVSERPLDEVVLDYLVENARKRKRRSR
jgi:hypothetical protein